MTGFKEFDVNIRIKVGINKRKDVVENIGVRA